MKPDFAFITLKLEISDYYDDYYGLLLTATAADCTSSFLYHDFNPSSLCLRLRFVKPFKHTGVGPCRRRDRRSRSRYPP